MVELLSSPNSEQVSPIPAKSSTANSIDSTPPRTPAIHKHPFKAIAILIAEEQAIVASFPISVSYLISIYEASLSKDSNGRSLTEGMRGVPSASTRANINRLLAHETAVQSVICELSTSTNVEIVQASVARFHELAKERSALAKLMKLSPLEGRFEMDWERSIKSEGRNKIINK